MTDATAAVAAALLALSGLGLSAWYLIVAAARAAFGEVLGAHWMRIVRTVAAVWIGFAAFLASANAVARMVA